ncbi:hypothetical protein HYR69_12275, partial [Candidatus Sumerlaeota bacterium]|nr:hypothetical protein [Candidatus Sumerlaeota bacterium]
LFGVQPDSPPEYEYDGLRAPGLQINFEGALASVPPQIVLTDLVPDRLYPLTPAEGTQVVARAVTHVVGTLRRTPSGGALVRLGFRPRDDQARSLGYETRTWFETLNAIGAYPASGKFDSNDNSQVLSRTTNYLVCGFPNGAVAIAPHFREIVDGWSGGFGRDAEKDKAYMDAHPIPPDTIHLEDFNVAGHRVTYNGSGFVVFRLSAEGRLEAFAGSGCQGVTIDGAAYDLAGEGIGALAFAPVPSPRRKDGGAVMTVIIHGTGEVRIPCAGLNAGARVIVEGPTPGSGGAMFPATVEGGILRFTATPEMSGRWLYVLRGE